MEPFEDEYKEAGAFHDLRRLREGVRVRGYARVEQGTTYYSRDLFWWTGIQIRHTEEDPFCGRKDLANRPLFHQDIVHFRKPGWFNRGKHFLIEHCEGSWQLRSWRSGKIYPFSLLDTCRELRFVSFAFLQA